MIVAYPYPANEDPAAELFFGFFYLVALASFLFILFGMVRTVATRMPIPSAGQLGADLDPELYPGDCISPRLYSFHPPSRKWLKVAVLFVELVFAGFSTYVLLDASARAQMDWLGWRLADNSYVWAGHLVVIVLLSIPLIMRAITYANKFPSTVTTND